MLVLVVQLRSPHDLGPAEIAVGLLLGWSFALAGLIAIARRPDNGTGRLLLAVGLGWLLAQLAVSGDPTLFTIGAASGALVLAALGHLVLAYPEGRLQTRFERRLVAAGYALAVLANVAELSLDPHPSCDKNCPDSVILVHRDIGAARAIDTVAGLLAIVVIGLVVVIAARRYRASTALARRRLRPIGVAGGASLVLLLLGFAVSLFSAHGQGALSTAALVLAITVPFWFLIGILRSRLARGEIATLLHDVRGTASLADAQAALRRALNDPGLQLGAWIADRHGYVDAEGAAFTTPADDAARVSTVVAGEDGTPVAVIVHDRALLDEPELLEGVAGAARLALERNRLQSELAARLDELQRERDFVRGVVNAAPAFFLVIDYDGRIVRFNDTMIHACGVADDDRVRGRYWWDVFLEPEDAAEASELTASVTVDEHQHRFRTRHGGALVVAWRFAPVVDSVGEPRLVLTGTDVSERVRQEEELRRERDYLQTVARSTPTLMCAVDAEGVVTERGVNAAFTSATGVTDDEAIGRPFWELVVAPEQVDAVRAAFLDAVLWGSADRRETPWHAAGGGELTVEWWVTSLEAYREGNFLVVGNDVTTRRRDEDELRRSRARLIEAADGERRRLERNLHDGAQQRLVSLSLALRLATSMLERDPATAQSVMGAAEEELKLALQELRELARGLHPAVLTDRGLEAALGALAERSPVVVELDIELADRLPGPVEAAAYYVVAESLTNVAKYAEASLARVRVGVEAGIVGVEVTDDGVGGADPSEGSGLRGLEDRVSALDGRLSVISPAGEGTRVLATIPLAQVRQPVPQNAG